jgi:NTP pyrophosphatase (non-canonical NTP hydrolase)
MTKGQKLTFGDLKSSNLRRCEAAFHKLMEWTPTDWACAMAGEAGEACNLIKKLRRLDGADKALDSPKLRAAIVRKAGEELADVVIYVDLLAARLGLDLGSEVRKKFNKVSKKRGVQIFL